MALFALNEAARAWFSGAVATAARALGVVELLGDRALTADEIARALSLPPRRLRPLLDVLVATGALHRRDGKLSPGAFPPSLELPPHGWGRLAEVVRRDRPLPDDEALASFHAHLRQAGAATANALMEWLAPLPAVAGGLVDLGGGAGAYAEAFLARWPDAPVTLVDRAPVIALALPFLDGRATLVAADLLDGAAMDAALPDGAHGIALYANVLHLYAADDCRALVARAARAVAPGGWVVVADLPVAADRSGPIDSLLFAVNMALYTDGGDVWDAPTIAGWLAAAGLEDVLVRESPEQLCLRARKPDRESDGEPARADDG